MGTAFHLSCAYTDVAKRSVHDRPPGAQASWQLLCSPSPEMKPLEPILFEAFSFAANGVHRVHGALGWDWY